MSKVALAGALALLMFFSYLTGIKTAFVFGYALSLLFLVAWAWPRLAIRGVTLQRRVDPGTPTVGEVYEEEFEVRRKGWIPAPWVEVRDLSQIADYQPGRVISLGGEIVKWRARGVYRRRGWMALGPTSLRVREPFGLFDRELKVTQRTSILVYPRVRPVPDLMTPSSQQVGTSQSLGAWADYPPETGGVRDYVTGDNFGRIHWPLSAKHQRLMSKTFEQPLTTDLWILLDLDRGVHFGDGEESTVEYSVSLAASMAAQVHSRGRQVGLVANDSRGTVLEPHRQAAPPRHRRDHAERGSRVGAPAASGARPPLDPHRVLPGRGQLRRARPEPELRPRPGRRPVCGAQGRRLRAPREDKGCDTYRLRAGWPVRRRLSRARWTGAA